LTEEGYEVCCIYRVEIPDERQTEKGDAWGGGYNSMKIGGGACGNPRALEARLEANLDGNERQEMESVLHNVSATSPRPESGARITAWAEGTKDGKNDIEICQSLNTSMWVLGLER